MENAKLEVKKQAVIKSYINNCSKLQTLEEGQKTEETQGHEPNKMIVRYLNEPCPNQEDLNFIFRGNYKLHFKHQHRISDNDIIALSPAFYKFADDLIHIDLSYNRISDQGAIAVADLLEKCQNNLLSFNIQGNDIGIEGAKAISKALQKTVSLEYLNIYLNNIQTDGCMNMVRFSLLTKRSRSSSTTPGSES
jgi:hypothetical protein